MRSKIIDSADRKKNLYKWVKIGGILSFIPFVLAAGPIAGYFLGNYLEERFHFSPYASFVCVIIGIIASTAEVVRIIKMALRAEEKV